MGPDTIAQAELQGASPLTGERSKVVALWALRGLLALFFVAAAAGPKLLGEATAVVMFRQIGLGGWFRYLVGAVELGGAVGLLVPRFVRPSALLLAALMVGAVATQLFVIDGGLLAITPAILLLLLAVVAGGRAVRAVDSSGTRWNTAAIGRYSDEPASLPSF